MAGIKEEKARAVQEAIYVLMKRHRVDMRDYVESSTKEARAGFNEAVNYAVEETVSKDRAKSEL